LAAVAAIVVAMWQKWWPFDTTPKPVSSYARPSIWQFLFSDRLTLGLVRIGIAALVFLRGGKCAGTRCRRPLA
jgi:hypothetical protein